MSKIRTRFAPSPTGRMHVGNLRTALYEYLIARHEHGTFVLRIEDTDQERFVPEALDIIYNTMKLTGLQHDEGPDKDGGYGPYVQSERMKTGVYLDYAKQLVEKGEAYYCFCTKERLEELRASTTQLRQLNKYDIWIPKPFFPKLPTACRKRSSTSKKSCSTSGQARRPRPC